MAKPLTDEQWIKQNSNLGPATCEKRGLCCWCGGKGGNFWVFGGERGYTLCPHCKGYGNAGKP